MWNLINKLNKENGDRLIDSRMTAIGGLVGGGIEEKGKWAHGQQCDDWWGKVAIRGLRGNIKKYSKNFF